MARATNNDFLFRGSAKKKTLPNISSVKESVGGILDNTRKISENRVRANGIWTTRRIISAILSVHEEYIRRRSAGETIVFNASFFAKSKFSDARYLTKKKLSGFAMRFYGDEVDNKDVLVDIDLKGFMSLALPRGAKKDEILSDFKKGWSPERLKMAILKAYEEYAEKRDAGEQAIFNSSFFMNSKTKDVRNLTKKLKSFAFSAFGGRAKNVRNIRDLIILTLEEGEMKNKILADFKKLK